MIESDRLQTEHPLMNQRESWVFLESYRLHEEPIRTPIDFTPTSCADRISNSVSPITKNSFANPSDSFVVIQQPVQLLLQPAHFGFESDPYPPSRKYCQRSAVLV